VPRNDVVIATKITGGRNMTPQNIIADCEASLKRLGTDYIDIYQLHWPPRYSPQSNWGQSLAYNLENEKKSPYWRAGGGPTSLKDLCTSMEKLIPSGKIRGWGFVQRLGLRFNRLYAHGPGAGARRRRVVVFKAIFFAAGSQK
jgi:aryl-alcohol dehydrogenase-like predicted oxidoreductase